MAKVTKKGDDTLYRSPLNQGDLVTWQDKGWVFVTKVKILEGDTSVIRYLLTLPSQAQTFEHDNKITTDGIQTVAFAKPPDVVQAGYTDVQKEIKDGDYVWVRHASGDLPFFLRIFKEFNKHGNPCTYPDGMDKKVAEFSGMAKFPEVWAIWAPYEEGVNINGK